MAFPLGTVLAAAPGIISAASDIIKLVRNRNRPDETQAVQDTRVDELASLIEKQAVLIEEMARNNQELALAVRNNRILTFVSLSVALLAVLLLFFS